MNEIRIKRLIALVGSKGDDCITDTKNCDFCSEKMNQICDSDPFSLEKYKQDRFEQAKTELESIPEHELFEVLL